jgi:hypothetical protein
LAQGSAETKVSTSEERMKELLLADGLLRQVITRALLQAGLLAEVWRAITK